MLRAAIVTVAMHATMLGAYAVLAVAVAPAAPLGALVAVSAIVMLAASLPISFAGWGIHELSAAYAFGAAGLVSEAGLTMAVAVGLLSLAALAGNLALALILGHDNATVSVSGTTDGHVAISFTRLLCWTAPLVAATFVVFQILLPTNSGWVTVNLADPIVIVGGLTMAALALTGGRWKKIWPVPEFNIALGVATVTLGLGFLHGWAVFGLTDWALYNRFWGWFVLVCYLLTGALITSVAGRIGLIAIFRTYIVACAAVVSIEFCLRLWGELIGLDFMKGPFTGFYGMIGNPNAFGLQLVLALAVGLSGGTFWGGHHGPVIQSTLLGLILAGVVLTGSRASAIALGCVVVTFLILGRLNLRHFMTTVSVAVIVVVTPIAVNHFGAHVQFLPANFLGIGRLDTIQPDRTLSIVEGWEMFKGHPILGAGLGAFMQKLVVETGKPLVIHSSYLWLLAEFGIVGFLAFMLLPVSIFRSMWLNRAWIKDWPAAAVLGCLVALAVMTLVHELVYQRAFWLLAGAALAIPKRLK